MKEFGKTVSIIKQKNWKIQEDSGHLTISFDKFTLVRNCHYTNLSLHGLNGFQSLRMICVRGSMKTERAIQLLCKKLDNQTVAAITDGVSAIMKLGLVSFTLPVLHMQPTLVFVICFINHIRLGLAKSGKNCMPGGIQSS